MTGAYAGITTGPQQVLAKVIGLKDNYARLQLFKWGLCVEGELIESRNRLQGARHRVSSLISDYKYPSKY
jgi:hypothetical protein